LLSNNGVLIIFGFLVFKKANEVETHFKRLRDQFFSDYQLMFGLRPFKGYFTPADLDKLKNAGFNTSRYGSAKEAVKAILKPKAAQPYRAVYHANG
jgi:hypothetical protein